MKEAIVFILLMGVFFIGLTLNPFSWFFPPDDDRWRWEVKV